MGDEGWLDDAERASLAVVRDLRDRLNAAAREHISPRMTLGIIQELEFLIGAVNAWQIELTAAAAVGLDERVAAAGLGFARRRHPQAGSRLVRQARVLTAEMPQVLAAMRAGEISEAHAAVLVRETEGLDPESKAGVARQVAEQWCGVGERRLADVTKAVVSRTDPGLAAVRAVAAAADRHVSWRAAPDSMMRISALLPAREGLGCVQALQAAAQERVAQQKPAVTLADRRRAMADAFVARTTGSLPGQMPAVDVRVNLLVPIDALTGDAPGWLDGYGTVSGRLARELIESCPDEAGPAVRRLFAAPGAGDLVGMESTSRTYRGLLKEFIRLRDRRCSTPYCDSPITQVDHITPVARGGPTSERNARGGCARCNQVKELPGYRVSGDASRVRTTIGAVSGIGGVSLTSGPPAPPGMSPPTDSRLERRFVDIVWTKVIVAPRRQ